MRRFHHTTCMLWSGLLTAAFAASEARSEIYGTAFLHSWHWGTEDLNDNTPGLALGRRWTSDPRNLEFHVEAGVFYNSYEEISPIALGGISLAVAEVGPGELRVGGSVGIARYTELSERLEANYGIPNVEGFIPIAVATLSYRWGDTDLRVSTVPPGEGVDAIFNISISRTLRRD